ncbi:MAG: UDP-N-acetylglucosamine 1-carboxyvinyltransferase [Nitrospirota bacterium]
MDKIIIEGGAGLKGEVRISGAKNAALPILASTILSPGTNTILNTPGLIDIKTMGKILTHLGAKVSVEEDRVKVDTTHINNPEAPYDLVRSMRASVLVLCPLIARMGEAKVSLPGGCAIGARPINLHLMGLEKMGAKVEIEHGYVKVKAKRLKGAKIYLDMPTVTGTENLMMAAALADGTTVIENAACEPEVSDLAEALKKMGARIEGAGMDVITIEGVNSLNPVEYSVIPDRIEAGTFMVAGAITDGNIKLKGCIPGHLDAVVAKIKEAGVEITEEEGGLRVKGIKRPKAVDIKTMTYPGFPTDMQAQMMALMSVADGISVITETIFENRFMHVAELRRMGADIKIEGNTAIVHGVPDISGAPLMATDLRASASLIIAGLAAKGKTTLSRVYHIDRGYEKIEKKLSALGARITREKDI